ncbi:MAG: S9 family peptidase [Pirellulales bacterium]
MAEKTTCPYGLWESPISPRSLAGDRRLEAARWDSDGRTLVWLEGRSGQGVLVAQDSPADAPRDLTTDLSVRAEVGYGGGDFTVHGGYVYFVVHKTGRIYRQAISGGAAKPITPAFGQAAAPTVSPDGRWLAYVHHDDANVDRLAVVDVEGTFWPQVLAAGHDFYMQPRWSPDGRRLAWIAWDHPRMPWDGALLELATVIQPDGLPPRLDTPEVVAGGPETAVFQPEFTPDGRRLLFVSDETGWGRIAWRDLESGRRGWLTPDGVEYGLPGWVQDMRTYAVGHNGRYLVAAANERGFQRIVRIDLETGQAAPVEAVAEYTEVLQIWAAGNDARFVFVGSGATTPPRVVECDLATGRARIVARASGENVPQSASAACEMISWPTGEDDMAHGLFFPSASDRFQAAGKPPLIVLIHGGPTAQVKAGWRAEAQFFATRGYAVLYVNYRGSTGYGRDYMLKLRGKWGVLDVEDAVSGARHLADAGRVDPDRTVIMGGSAGGFTVLQTMVDHPEAFRAGISLYGVADQFQLAAETHKFEAHYLDSLLGPLPEAAAIYRVRSPVLRADRIRRPMAIFQGEIDQVVPRAQAEAIVEALKRNGTPHVYQVYEGEGHGWRKAETIERFYQAVDAFLRQYVLFA